MQLDDQELPLTRAQLRELDGGAFALTRGQLDIWLAQETGDCATEWQLGLFVRIEGAVDRDALRWAIRRAVREAEPVRAGFVEADGRVWQRVIDYPDVELAFYDLSGARDPVHADAPWWAVVQVCVVSDPA
jgi:hypothetical protein